MKHGVVALSGQVPSFGEKYEAVKAAKRVYGVTGVADVLDVKIPGVSERTDTDIAQAAVEALQAHVAVPDERIQVTVRGAWVTLEGSVEWEHQRAAAESCVRYLTGVTGVSNAITIKPRGSPAGIRKKIEEALQRSEAEQVVWAARGVSSVDNQIETRP